MMLRYRSILISAIVGALFVAGEAAGQNGVILEQDLDTNGQGYSILHVWGSHYEMGYAQAHLLGDHIVSAVEEFKIAIGEKYPELRTWIAVSLWKPDEIEDELDGMVAALAETHPGAAIDKVDLKILSTSGDWAYACRSHMAWGRYVAFPTKTLATRRLDMPVSTNMARHHVLCARDPDDGSPQWVNLGWPGVISASTAVNEFGTLVSLHDYETTPNPDFRQPGRIPRAVAARYALTFPTSHDPSTHLTDVVTELQGYEIMTGGFINYYVPEGYGGVMTVNPYAAGPDTYGPRVPHEWWHHGEAMITTNGWTDGIITPEDEDFGADAYYSDESPKTLESHWNLLAAPYSLHMLSVAYRGRRDMTVWADGRVGNSFYRTPRLELEWSELFDPTHVPEPSARIQQMTVLVAFAALAAIRKRRRGWMR